jgi:hypothetical protein
MQASDITAMTLRLREARAALEREKHERLKLSSTVGGLRAANAKLQALVAYLRAKDSPPS